MIAVADPGPQRDRNPSVIVDKPTPPHPCVTWAHPVAFRSLPGWHTGGGVTFDSIVSRGRRYRLATPVTSAWIATDDVRYLDPPSEDPPNRTLEHLGRTGTIVYVVAWPTTARREGASPTRLLFARAKYHACCEVVLLPGGE